MKLLRILINDTSLIITTLRESGWRDTMQMLHSRDAPSIVQFAKYGICGVGAAIIHNGVFIGLIFTLLPTFPESEIDGEMREKNAMIANLVAFPFANMFAYFANKLWVFTSGRHSQKREFLLFTGVSFLSFSVGLLGGPILIAEGLPVFTAQIGFIVTAALVNFVCRKFLVFLK